MGGTGRYDPVDNEMLCLTCGRKWTPKTMGRGQIAEESWNCPGGCFPEKNFMIYQLLVFDEENRRIVDTFYATKLMAEHYREIYAPKGSGKKSILKTLEVKAKNE